MKPVFYSPGQKYQSPSVSSENTLQNPATWLEIDVEVLHDNVQTVQKYIGGVGIIGIVKADGYGLGLVPVATELLKAGVQILGVATSFDAIQLRRSGIQERILVIYPVLDEYLDELIANNIDITLTSVNQLSSCEAIAEKTQNNVNIHLQLETGMHHYGMDTTDIEEFAGVIAASKRIKFAGVSTHFASVGSDDLLTNSQYEHFVEALKKITALGLKPEFIHCANSAAVDMFVASWDKSQYELIAPHSRTLVRVGSLFYGTYPAKSLGLQTQLPARRLISHIAEIKSIKKGDKVGYFSSYIADEDKVIAILPVGWGANGYFPANGVAIILDEEAPLIGAVSANTSVIDVTRLKDCKVGQEVVLYSADDERISMQKVAQNQSMFVSRALSAFGLTNQRGYIDSRLS